MVTVTLTELFERDLQRLKKEIELYKDEDNLWIVKEGINNTAGNLCLHLLGNLNYYIGATLGNTGYIRHRDDEFSLKNIPRQDLVLNIENCRLIIKSSLDKLEEQDLEKEFPVQVFEHKVTTLFMLMHLTTHLTYHLGQINYHRRLLDQ
ncbi:MAG: DinB family protein [Ferruginibacter sp.]|nr:DinB family protein [Ferruginibacter sp.]